MVRTADGELAGTRVIIATGGLSVPKTGSDGFGLVLARALGHVVQPTYAALTPLTDSPPAHAEPGRRVAARAARRHVDP